jgi:hypothetical protein
MELAGARAKLVDLSDTSAASALTVTMPRRHVEEALSADEPMDLVLDVSRSSGDDPAETSQIAVAWERGDLEELLRRSGGDSITISLDEDALRRLLDPEFEAHGMRGALAVLAVAVAAGGVASAATAYPSEGTRLSGAAAIEQAAPGAQIEAVRSAAALSAPTAASGIEAVRSAEPIAADTGSLAAASGIEAVRSAEPLAASADTGSLAAASGIEAVRSAEPIAADTGSLAAASGIEAVRSAEPLASADTGSLAAASGIEAVRSAEPLASADTGSLAAASGIEAVRSAEPLAATSGRQLAAADAIEAVRSSDPMPASSDAGVLASSSEIEAARSAEAASLRAPSPTDGGFAISAPGPETTAALIGGFALLITGAAFVGRSKRHELRLP